MLQRAGAVRRWQLMTAGLLAGAAALSTQARASTLKCWGGLVEPSTCAAAGPRWPVTQPLTVTVICEACSPALPSDPRPDGGAALPRCDRVTNGGTLRLVPATDGGASILAGTWTDTGQRCGEGAVYRFGGTQQPDTAYTVRYPGAREHSLPPSLFPFEVTLTTGPPAPDARSVDARSDVADAAGPDAAGPDAAGPDAAAPDVDAPIAAGWDGGRDARDAPEETLRGPPRAGGCSAAGGAPGGLALVSVLVALRAAARARRSPRGPSGAPRRA